MDFIFDPSLVLYLPLHELDGVAFQSKDAYRHPCTATGAIWRPTGRYFDGTDDYIAAGNHTAINNCKTVEAWFQSTRASTEQGIVSRYLDNTNRWLIVIRASDNKIKMFHPPASNYIIQSDNAIGGDGEWHHMAVTYDGTLQMYVDSYLQASTSTYDPLGEGDGGTVHIGTYFYNSATTGEFRGLIGEVRVYNRALTPLEIQRNYLATKWRYR